MDIAGIIFKYLKYKKYILIGAANVVGLILIILLVKAVSWATTASAPDIRSAEPEKVITYLASEQMADLPKSRRLEFVQGTLQRFVESPDMRSQFVQQIENLSDFQAQQLAENVSDAAKDQLVEESKEYVKLDKSQKEEYLKKQYDKWTSLQSMITGRSSSSGGGKQAAVGFGGGAKRKNTTGAPNIAANPKFTKAVPQTPAGMYKKLLSGSTPTERAKLETYINDANNYYQKIKSLQKAQK
jgi:hypothetical protein